MNSAWLSLNEYAQKYHVSVSTLRRRIRNKEILFRVNEGKYLVSDTSTQLEAPGRKRIEVPGEVVHPKEASTGEAGGFFSAAHKLLEELKRAYTLILQEKEEQICQLKEEISDLRTLVRVLESENERLRIKK